jgi:hypothetical protein
MPEECLWAFEEISKIGAAKGYSPDSWKLEHPFSHALKAAGHIMDFLLGRDQERHLYHAMWRVCAAVAVTINMRRMHVAETGMNLTSIKNYDTP